MHLPAWTVWGLRSCPSRVSTLRHAPGSWCKRRWQAWGAAPRSQRRPAARGSPSNTASWVEVFGFARTNGSGPSWLSRPACCIPRSRARPTHPGRGTPWTNGRSCWTGAWGRGCACPIATTLTLAAHVQMAEPYVAIHFVDTSRRDHRASQSRPDPNRRCVAMTSRTWAGLLGMLGVVVGHSGCSACRRVCRHERTRRGRQPRRPERAASYLSITRVAGGGLERNGASGLGEPQLRAARSPDVRRQRNRCR